MATTSTVTFALGIEETPYVTEAAKNATYYYNTQGDATAEYFLTANVGTITLSNGFANLTITANLDALGPSEGKAYTIKIRRGSASGPIIASSNTINILGDNRLYNGVIGGNTSISGGYRVHEFRSSGNLEITSVGATVFNQIDYLVVGGGGGAGSPVGGGGGAGGMITGSSSSLITEVGNLLIIVGAGGTQAIESPNTIGTQGGNSFIGSSLSAHGGGVGLSYQNRVATPTLGFGGSGGGGTYQTGTPTGQGIPGQGNPGGTSPGGPGAGGGGKGAVGGSVPPAGGNGGSGGIGQSVSWVTPFIGTTGPTPGRWFAGGGGGGGVPVNGSGGAGGGGTASQGVAYTGGGGGGAFGDGFAGGSGAVAIRYPFRSPVTYSMVTSKGSIHAGNSVSFAVVVNNIVAENAKYYYSISGNISQSELSNSITGNFYTQNGYANINIFTNQTIPSGETRTLQFDMRRLSTDGKILSSSEVVTVYGDTSAILPFDALGGSITTDGPYKIHVFSTSDTFFVREGTSEIEYLVVAGGGAGGPGAGNVGAGGGGAGGLLRGNTNVSVGSYSVTVGGGAALTPQVGNRPLPGGNTILGGGLNLIAVGGGSGGAFDATVPGNGGSGSGRTWNSSPPFPAGLGYPGQGNPGGESSGVPTGGGGGGGAEAAGGNAPSTTVGGKGGNGIFSSITGSNVAYAGGGGGGSGTGGLGGWGGGGNGGSSTPGANATENTGGGGGGAGQGGRPGGTGGSGVVVIRYIQP
jgi:hypothetical protein